MNIAPDATMHDQGHCRLRFSDDDDVHYCICQRLELERETENMGVCTKERKGDTAEVLVNVESL